MIAERMQTKMIAVGGGRHKCERRVRLVDQGERVARRDSKADERPAESERDSDGHIAFHSQNAEVHDKQHLEDGDDRQYEEERGNVELLARDEQGERDDDERDHGGDEREEPRLCHAVVEELHSDEGVVEKPQVVVPRKKQGEVDESARRVVSGFLFDCGDFGTASLVVIWVPLGPCRTVGNAFRFALRRRKRAKARKMHF